MKCSRCDGVMEDRLVRFCVCQMTPMIVIDGVPAKVCLRCGGQVFSDEVAEKIEMIRDGQSHGVRYAFVWAFEYEEIGKPEQAPAANGVAASSSTAPSDLKTLLIDSQSPFTRRLETAAGRSYVTTP